MIMKRGDRIFIFNLFGKVTVTITSEGTSGETDLVPKVSKSKEDGPCSECNKDPCLCAKFAEGEGDGALIM